MNTNNFTFTNTSIGATSYAWDFGDGITSALTNLDQHDIARSSKTFGLDRFYIVTPSEEQRKLAERISGHWQQGWGAAYNPDRRQALDIVRVTPSLASAVADFQGGFSKSVKIVVTGASDGVTRTISSACLRSGL